MCIGKGFLVRRYQTEPDYVLDSNDHFPLVKKFNLQDDKLIDRNFVRIEMLPLDSLTSAKYKDWEFKVDEKGTLPGWFEEDIEVWKEKCLYILTTKIIPIWVKNGVGGDLDLRGTQVKDLGSLKSVGGSLYLRGTQVKDLGSLKSVGGYLDLECTQVKDLGSLKSVGGDLNLYNTQIKSLGSLKSVGGSLYLRGTQVKDIPKELVVKGNIFK